MWEICKWTETLPVTLIFLIKKSVLQDALGGNLNLPSLWSIIQPGIWAKPIFSLSLFCFLDTFLKKVGVNQIMKSFVIDLHFIFRNVTEKEKNIGSNM